ncbi:putative membrane protein [Marinilactibacillus piezotolerans]|uniref:Putative membrane protein n=1 Tax=Marinilactibacillus piezotolerans TaxID=258723 RepID=A0A1I3ZEW6_9LACT|nr:PH domain-containing protein [Marinilactibacillus piezotolerans]SFK42708.1 putative membrane protein [Marinilactibacillus piezotolerans]
MFNKQRLHKLTLVTQFYNILVRILSGSFFIIVLAFFQEPDLSNILIFLGIFLALSLLLFVVETVKYFRTYYWIEGNRLVLQTGLFIQKEKDIQISRIQSIDTSEDIVHRLLKVTKITVNTPGQGLILDALSVSQYKALSDYLNQLKISLNKRTEDEFPEDKLAVDDNSEVIRSEAEDAPAETTLLQLSVGEIVKMTILNGAIFRGFFIFLIGFNFLTDLPLDDLFTEVGSVFISASIIILLASIFIGMILIYTIGIIASIIKNYGYKVTLSGEHLNIKKGLLETQSQTVPLKNVQTLEEKQNWLMKFFGYTTFSLGLTSDSSQKNNENKTEIKEDGQVVLFPIVKSEKLNPLVKQCFPEFVLSPVENVVPVRSIRRFIQFPVLFWLIIAAAISIMFWVYAWIAGLILILFYGFYGYRSYKLTGYHLCENEITVQTPTLFALTKTYVPKNRILNLQVKQNLFLKRANLMKTNFSTAHGIASKEFKLKYIEEKDAFKIFEWFRNGGIN